MLSVPAAELHLADRMQAALGLSKDAYRALDMSLPASFIGLSVFGLCATQLLILAQTNRWIDLSPDNLTFQLEPHESHLHAGYRIEQVRLDELPASEERMPMLTEAWTRFHRDTTVPLVESAARHAGVKPQLIWNQFPARQSFLRDYIREHERRPDVLARFHDEDRLLSSLPPALFHLRKNPFVHRPKYIPSPYQEGRNMIIRSSCCMYYKREDGKKCFHCPMLTEREREEMRAAIQRA